jgi:hypothetical protein
VVFAKSCRSGNDPIADAGKLMQKLRMARSAVAILSLSLGLWLVLMFNGYVIVRDKTGVVQKVLAINRQQNQTLTAIPFGFFVAIPHLEGEVKVICSDGSTVSGGYVTRGSTVTLTVAGDGTCEKLVPLRLVPTPPAV